MSNSGGLVAESNTSALIIQDSWTTVNIESRGDIGGLVGQMKNGTITNSYATGNIIGENTLRGGGLRLLIVRCEFFLLVTCRCSGSGFSRSPALHNHESCHAKNMLLYFDLNSFFCVVLFS